MISGKYRHYGCRIIDEINYKGMRTIFLENELLRIGILLDKGADIFQFLYKPTDTDFLWRSPRGLFDPRKYRATSSTTEAAFLDYYHGGWQEIFPGGGPTNYRGAELGLHGEVTHLGWDYIIKEDTPEEISIELSVECNRTPFKLERVMCLKRGKAALFFEEKLTNLSPNKQEFMWGHHPAFGAPFLRKGLKLYIPAEDVEVHNPAFAASGILEPGSCFKWPSIDLDDRSIDFSKIQGPEAGFSELLYLKNLSSGWYALLDQEKKIGLGLAWPIEVFPYVWFWLVYGKAPGYPWWDRVYCIALEPWTSIPNNFSEAQKRRTPGLLEGGEELEVAFTAVVINGEEKVKSVNLDGSIKSS